MRESSHRWWWLVAALVLPLIALLVYLAIAPRWALASYRAALEAAGGRLTLEACMPPRVAEHHRAALRFQMAAQALPRIPSTGRSILLPPPTMGMVAPGKAMAGWVEPVITDGQNRHSWDELAEWVRKAGPQLGEIHEAARAEAFNWNLDWSQGMMLMLPHLGPTKSTAQWLLAEAALALREGRRDDALDAQLTQLRVVHNLGAEGLLIGQLVRIAVAAIAWNGLWELLQTEGWTEDQLARLQAAWEGVEFVDAMVHSMEAERALGLYEYDRARRSPAHLRQVLDSSIIGGGLGGAPPAAEGWLNRGLELADKTYTKLRHGSRALLWATFESYEDERFYIESLETMLRDARDRAAAVSATAGRPVPFPAGTSFVPRLAYAESDAERHLLASMILISLDRAFEKAFLMQAQRELARTAIALQRYQLRHKRFPESLADLVPQYLAVVPCDWMDGAPLRYRRGGEGEFTLYSVGRDGEDNGGDASPVDPMVRGYGLHSARDFVWPTVATVEEIEAYRTRARP